MHVDISENDRPTIDFIFVSGPPVSVCFLKLFCQSAARKVRDILRRICADFRELRPRRRPTEFDVRDLGQVIDMRYFN